MENNVFYTKGDKEDVVSRIGQVHTITIFCPLNDFGVQSLKGTFELMLPKYKVDENKWINVPSVDALNAFLFTSSYFTTCGLEVNKDIISIIISSLKMFRKLKKISFEFTDDPEIENTYKILLKKTTDGVKKYIYRVDVLEMNLSDMFSQTIVDILNKVFIYNEIISNSYLDRKFKLEFTFDEYVSYIDMFINNNHSNLNELGGNICDYFRTFPQLVNEQKPKIRLLTNYKDDVNI